MNKKLALYKSRDFINKLEYDKFEAAPNNFDVVLVYFKLEGIKKSEILIGIDLNGCYDEFFEDGNIDEEKVEKIVKWLMLKKAVNWEDDKSSIRIKLRDEFVRYEGDTPVIILKNIDYVTVEDEMDKVSDNYLFEVYFLDDNQTINIDANALAEALDKVSKEDHLEKHF